jgi:hypothetical protein
MLSKTFMLFSGEDTDNDHSDEIGKVMAVPTYSKTETHQAKPFTDENTQTTKATLDDVKEVFKLYLTKFPKDGYFAWLDGLYAEGKISKKFSNNKDKTEVYWTLDDIITLKNELDLPF